MTILINTFILKPSLYVMTKIPTTLSCSIRDKMSSCPDTVYEIEDSIGGRIR